MLKSIRIVWNLTNACPYHCNFCAAAANSHTAPAVDKSAILESIYSVPIPISIDFSGGDPLYQTSDIKIIESASQTLGRDQIEISTTGLSLSKLSDDVVMTLASEYGLTYDLPRSLSDANRPGYNQHNYEQALRLKELQIPFEITLPVRPLPFNLLLELATDLVVLHPQRIALLQMMPLGRSQVQDFRYSITETNQLISFLRAGGYDGKITTSCAFRSECNGMSHRKFGLDEYGNLFGCIWAADLNLPLSRNEFYLGNLLSEPLINILKHNLSKITHLNRTSCYVIKQSTTEAAT